MAQENIKSRKYYRVHNGTDWDRMHFVTDANSVDANDGDNMETKVGAIKGITTSTEVTEKGYAADATTVAALNSSLGGISLHENPIIEGVVQEGLYYMGADSVLKKLGSPDTSEITYSTNTTNLDPKKIYFYSGSTCAYGYGNLILKITTDGTMHNEYNYTGRKVTGDYCYHNRTGILTGATNIKFSSTPNAMWLYKVVYEIG